MTDTLGSMAAPLELILATSNPHKVEELQSLLSDLNIKVQGLKDLGIRTYEPHETGKTFVENAIIKAISYAAQTERICLADDSGLEIDALGGRPGVISSHYCTDGAETGMSRAERDQANNARVLRELKDVAFEKRTARFVCVIIVAAPHNPIPLNVCRGSFEGRIGIGPEVPRGDNGFGYDPLFLVPPDFRRTSAELSPSEKNAISHRARAAEQLIQWLRNGGLSAMQSSYAHP
jgi:non-canonical purine NTP pyrophosphatase (RdgB/HAM1 family)